MGETARGGLPYPADVDPADVPTDLNELATRVALVAVVYDEGPIGDRPLPTAVVEGMFWRQTDGTDNTGLGTFTWCNGSAWLPVPIGGGSMLRSEVRRMKLRDTTETMVDMGNVSGNPVNVDLSLGNYFKLRLIGATTLAFTNVPATADGLVQATLRVLQDGVGGRVLTLPTHRKPSGVALAPTTTANARNIYEVLSEDGGASWDIFLSGKDMK